MGVEAESGEKRDREGWFKVIAILSVAAIFGFLFFRWAGIFPDSIELPCKPQDYGIEKCPESHFPYYLWLWPIALFDEHNGLFQALAALASASFAGILYFVTKGQARLIQQSADAATKGADAAARASAVAAAVELPIFHIKQIQILSATGNYITKLPLTEPFKIYVYPKNLGRTPAFLTENCLLWYWDKDLPKTPVYDFGVIEPAMTGTVVNPDEACRMETFSIDPVAGRETLWAYGFFSYKDVLGEEWEIGFCAKWQQPPNDNTRGYFYEGGPPAYTFKRRKKASGWPGNREQ
jgi:hypothetical protein